MFLFMGRPRGVRPAIIFACLSIVACSPIPGTLFFWEEREVLLPDLWHFLTQLMICTWRETQVGCKNVECCSKKYWLMFIKMLMEISEFTIKKKLIVLMENVEQRIIEHYVENFNDQFGLPTRIVLINTKVHMCAWSGVEKKYANKLQQRRW